MFKPFRLLSFAALLFSCAPSSHADRVALERPMGTGGAFGGGGGAVPPPATATGGSGGTGQAGAGGAPSLPGSGGRAAGGSGGAASGGRAGSGGAAPGSGGAGGVAGASGAGGAGGSDAAVAMPDADAVPSGPTALLVVADPTAMAAVDTKLKVLLEAKGMRVTMGDDDGMGSQANGTRIVVLSGTSASEKLASKFRDIPTPILVLVPQVYDDMGMTPGGDGNFGEDDATQVAIAMGAHPLAAGLTGNVGVLTGGASKLGWGKPTATAAKIATFTGGGANAMKVAIFGYDKGALMVSPTLAPARRVGAFITDAAIASLNANGEKLLGAAIDWLLAGM